MLWCERSPRLIQAEVHPHSDVTQNAEDRNEHRRERPHRWIVEADIGVDHAADPDQIADSHQARMRSSLPLGARVVWDLSSSSAYAAADQNDENRDPDPSGVR